MSKHEALLDSSPGYRAFVEEQQEIDEDLDLTEDFADWLLVVVDDSEFDDWTADDFRAGWDHWNS